MDEINLPDNFVPIAISDEFAFIAESGENMKGVKAFQVNQSGKLAHVSTLFESITINELVAKGSTLIGKSQQGIHSSFGLSEWPIHEQSGNFYFSLDQFDISDNGVAIPTGAYGVEWIDHPADKTNDSQATRRSSLSNSWQNMDQDQIWIYSFEDSPVHFDLNATRTWKFRPKTSIDEQSNVKNWKSVVGLVHFTIFTSPGFSSKTSNGFISKKQTTAASGSGQVLLDGYGIHHPFSLLLFKFERCLDFH